MIQRIQTLYLLVIVILSGFIIFSPIADLINYVDKLTYLVNFKGVSLVTPTGNTIVSNIWGLTAISMVVPVISLISIFSFKNRIKQIRFSVINMIFMLAYYVFLCYYIWSACSQLHTDWHLRLSTVFPLVNLILNYLAIGAIGKDENLVKSADRLR
jgi:hypothetical protein